MGFQKNPVKARNPLKNSVTLDHCGVSQFPGGGVEHGSGHS